MSAGPVADITELRAAAQAAASAGINLALAEDEGNEDLGDAIDLVRTTATALDEVLRRGSP